MSKFLRNAYFQGIFFSLLAMAVSITINVVLYPLYWTSLKSAEFVRWFSIYELSFFFLLLDLGFTQNYIKNNVSASNEVIEQNYHKLRGTMLFIGLLALALQIPFFYFAAKPINSYDFLPYLLLAISTAITLYSYSEAAALRVLLRFKTIYLISVAANITFLAVVFFGLEYGVYAIAVGSLIRAVLQSVLQTLALSIKISINTKLEFVRDGSLSAFYMNSSYLLLFAFDAMIFSKLGVKAEDVSSYMANRKLFDVARGFFDAAMNIVSVKLAGHTSNGLTISAVGVITSLFVVSYLIGPIVFPFLFGNDSYNSELSFALAFASVAASLYRFTQISVFMSDLRSNLIFLFIGALGAKLISYLALQLAPSRIDLFYKIQAILILGLALIFLWKILHEKKLIRKSGALVI